MNLETLSTDIHPEFIKLADFINANGFKVGIVGGLLRDYILNNEVGIDYDLELRLINQADLLIPKYQELTDLLKKNYQCEELAFNILKIDLNHISAEISLPRIETYSDSFHHSNITAEFIKDTEYDLGFKRRDLTLNAMMLEYENGVFTFRDPLNGKNDLESQILKACSADFSKDPVRFLRALRFSLKYGFKLDEQLAIKFKDLKWNDFTSHYLQLEAFKSGKVFSFIYQLNYLITNLEITNIDPHLFAYEDEIKGKSFKDMISACLILPEEMKELLKSYFKVRVPSLSFHNIQFESFRDRTVNIEEMLSVFDALSNLPEEQIQFYQKYNIIDLDYDEISKIKKMKIDSQNIENKDRKHFIFTEKLKSFYGN